MIGLTQKLPAPLFLLTALLLSTSVFSSELNVIGEPVNARHFQFHRVDADMDVDKYRQTYRRNQGKLLRLVKDYSESHLISLGVPRKGVHFLGAVAAAAVTQDATFYLNSSKLLAIEVKDAAEEDRAIFFGAKFRW